MFQQRMFKKFVVIGLAGAMIAPGAAAARPLDDPPSTPAVTVQDLRAPDQVGGRAQQPAQDLRAPDQVAGGMPPAAQDLRAPDQVAPAQPIRTTATSSDDGGLDTGWLIGLIGLGSVALLGAGYAYLIHARGPKRAAA